jgi:tetratricopeptide (TPR) repeat protein
LPRRGLARFLVLVGWVACWPLLAQAPIKDPLQRARTFYNAGRYTEAIEAATEARRVPAVAAAADIVRARSYLERFRAALAEGRQAPVDLLTARDALKGIDPARLTPRDRADFFTGVGQSLYLEDQAGGPPLYGAAAEMFDLAMANLGDQGRAERELLIEWWAGALDRQAQLAPDSERRGIYLRVMRRAEEELSRRELSAAALYWVAAAARGADDIERAWGAAVAAWIRAPQLGAEGAKLRDDLDRLVTHAILPERARQMTPAALSRAQLSVLIQQWEDLKQKWIK